MLEPSLPTLACLLLLETDTEADVVGAEAGVVAVAEGRTQGRAGIVPGAAPMDTAGGRSRTLRISLCSRTVVCVPIRCPFPHIAVHIKKAPGVGIV